MFFQNPITLFFNQNSFSKSNFKVLMFKVLWMSSLNREIKSNRNREVSVAERSKAPDSSL
jgi:hypothetical protein